MGRKEGNPGNKGGGRKSAYQEFLDAQWHNEKWYKNTDMAKLAKKIQSGKYSVRDIYLYKALTAKSDRILSSFGDKILPDISMMIGASGGAVEIDFLGEAEKRVKKWEEIDESEDEPEETDVDGNVIEPSTK